MTRVEKNAFKKWASKLTDDELEQEYYKAVFDSQGSEAEEMYDRGYDMVDIMEQEKYERDLCVKSDILEGLCVERGIKLWEEADGNAD